MEVPWHRADQNPPLVYNPKQTGVFTFAGIIEDSTTAVNRMGIIPKIFVENRQATPYTTAPRSAEWLDRAVIAGPVNDGNGILVQWRLLATEYTQNLTFNVYRNGHKINTSPISTLNFVDREGMHGYEYVVEVVETGERTAPVVALPANFIEIPVQRPSSRENPAHAFGGSGGGYIEYYINDMSVADVDGDGKYEVLVRWQPSMAQDPGLTPRHTGETIFDLYTLEGKLLWRINLGINITSSAHHSPFTFFDLDKSGFAKFAVKTAEGTRVYHPDEDGIVRETVDGGEPIYVIGGAPYRVWVGGTICPVRNVQNTAATGRVNDGPEYLTVFCGKSALPLDTVDYFAPYGIREDTWGDNWNNRADRFVSGLAFMPKGGVEGDVPYPTIIEGRQHYGPHHVAAYQFIDGKIIKIWEFDYRHWDAAHYQGNHQLAVADVDGNGYDDVIFGSVALNHKGEVLWNADGSRGTISAGHGDALHMSIMLPGSDTFYRMSPHEAPPPNNVTVFDAATGRPIWTYDSPVSDVGRGVAGNVTPLPGFEVWATRTPMHNLLTGEMITILPGGADTGYGDGPGVPVNHLLYWTGTLYRQFLDGMPDHPLAITGLRLDTSDNTAEHVLIQRFDGTLSNNGTKANPGLQADILGDWREEVIVRRADNEAIRIYFTDFPTDYVIYTLMHDPVYRLAINWQNVVYNQPPHLGFYLGEDIADQVLARELPVPNIALTIDPSGDDPPGDDPPGDDRPDDDPPDDDPPGDDPLGDDPPGDDPPGDDPPGDDPPGDDPHNVPKDDLPKTGGMPFSIFYTLGGLITGMGILMLGSGLLLKKKRKT